MRTGRSSYVIRRTSVPSRMGSGSGTEAIDRDLATDLVTALYRHLLGREPDPEGLDAWRQSAMRGTSVERLIADFVSTDEFKQFRLSEVWRTAASASSLPGVTDVEVPIVAQLFETAARYWRRAGQAPDEIYFSVLTSDRNRSEFGAREAAKFVRKGATTFDGVADLLGRYGTVAFEEATCLDFGSGVGRLAINAARRFAKVCAVDFSRGHLDEMLRNIDRVAPELISRIETVHVRDLGDLAALPMVDYCFSMLTLQHNPPPVIAYMVKALLGRLNDGGAAVLHVPIHHPFYRFDLAEYLASETAGAAMEMHILPRDDLRACVEAAGCAIRDSFNPGYTKGIYSEVFVITRPVGPRSA